MNFFKAFIHFFVVITIGIVIIFAIDGALSNYETLPQIFIPQILVASSVTSLVTAIIFICEAKTKWQYLVQVAVHYVILCAIMVTIGISFGWINPTAILLMCVYVAIVYAIVFLISYFLLKKEADNFNKAINKRRGKS